ncbi:MAG: sugar ABC transporter ATP-binding protein [Acetivibrionales bacterium]|jgi:ABC-type sugar transport system ATPase subunit
MCEVKEILSMEGICKSFYNNEVLKDINLTLNEGEILSILGENGAGKSTLMKILSGVHPAQTYKGSIKIKGENKIFKSPYDAQMAGIAMIYQEINVELDLTVAENIMIGRLIKNRFGLVDWKEVQRQAKQILKTLGLEIDVNTIMRNLSASMQQLVCIARALVIKPYLLILDEPTAALTETETEFLMDTLKKLKSKGISCIYISHKLNEVLKISDRIVVLRDGSLISSYTKENFNNEKIIEDIIGRKLEVMYPKVNKKIGEVALKVEHITVPHPYSSKLNIIKDVSMEVRKGEILGLAGLVGSGRSELLKAIYGLIPRKAGTIFVEGREVNISSPIEAQKLGLSILTEDRKRDGYVGCLNVRMNMTLCILNELKKGLFIDHRREDDLVNQYYNGLNIKASSPEANILSLSGGNQQKVLIGKALMGKPKILFLDEPTRGVDVGAKSEIYKIINELAANGMSIIVISSELPELISICDRFLVLSGGRINGILSKEEVSEAKILGLATSN